MNTSPSALFEESVGAIDARVDHQMQEMADAVAETIQERIALGCRLLADEGHGRSLAGMATMRAAQPGTYWTNSMGFGLADARTGTIVRIDGDMNVVEGEGAPNPGVRFHLWIYERRPELQSIVHTHPPHASALSLTGRQLVVAHMDATMFYDDCAYLAHWPGVPLYNEEGRIISEALGDKRSILLAHHGLLTTGRSFDEALYLAICLERACEMQMAALAVGEIKPIEPERAADGHSFMTKPTLITASVSYWLRQVRRRHPDAVGHLASA